MFGKTALRRACEADDTGLVRDLIALGAESNAKDHFQYVPLHIAVNEGKVSVVNIVRIQILETFDTSITFRAPHWTER